MAENSNCVRHRLNKSSLLVRHFNNRLQRPDTNFLSSNDFSRSELKSHFPWSHNCHRWDQPRTILPADCCSALILFFSLPRRSIRLKTFSWELFTAEHTLAPSGSLSPVDQVAFSSPSVPGSTGVTNQERRILYLQGIKCSPVYNYRLIVFWTQR